MVYIYKKIIGKKPYYYLRASEKRGKKLITKDIAYLGNSIDDVKKALEKLPRYKEEIRRSYKKISKLLESDYYAKKIGELKLKHDEFLEDKLSEAEACKLHFNDVFQKLDELTKQEIYKNFIVEYAYNTTSIEGNTIKLEEARNLLEEGKTPKNKTLREIYDLQNTEKIFFELLNCKDEISHELIIKIHAGLMENIDLRKGGYRTRDVRVIRSHFDSTPFHFVKADMDMLLKWYNENKERLHPIALASIFHHKFEKIHPFMDGNGRTGRMLLNYILLKKSYPPVVIHNKSRQEYLSVLGKADESNLPESKKSCYLPLVLYIANELIGYYWDIFL